MNQPLAKIFSENIQYGQFKEVLPIYEWNKKRFEEERNYFLWWLQNPESGGKFNFTDQVSAWEEYKRQHEYSEIEPEMEEDYVSWTEELREVMDRKLNTIEFLGNYEYRKLGTLPAQQ